MSRRNIIFLVLDSLSYETLNLYPFPDELFINSFIKKDSTVYENVYTQGPYTEASMNGLAYGQRGLDGGSFMFSHSKFDHSFVDNIHKDYETFCSGMSCRLFIDHCYSSFDKFHYHFYTPTTLPTLQWNRLDHFVKLSKNRPLSREEVRCVTSLVEYGLNDTLRFLNNFLDKKYQTSLSKTFIRETDVTALKNDVEKELSNFKTNTAKYIQDILSGNINFTQFDFNYYVTYNNKKLATNVFDTYKKKLIHLATKHYVFRPRQYKLFFNTLFNNSTATIKDAVRVLFISTRNKRWIKKNYQDLIVANNNKKRAISFSRCLDSIYSFISNRSGEKPFFVYCQPDDFHPLSTFWTYDSNDEQTIKSELECALNLAKRIKLKNCNIFDFLSIKYLDNKVKELFDFLINNDLIENTDVVITADHGSWNLNNAIRTDKNLIMTEERMHIPCLFYQKGQGFKAEHNLHNSYSIPNTILSFMGYETDEYFFGKCFSEDKNKYLLSENLGFGCPDVFGTPINYVIHNKEYKLNVLARINEDVRLSNCTSFYNLKKDPLEERNIISKTIKTNQELVSEMLQPAKLRHDELKKELKPLTFYSPHKN